MVLPNDKPFCKETWKKYDAMGKEVLLGWLNQFRFSDIAVNEAEEKGDFKKLWDMSAVAPDGRTLVFDPEVKADWGTEWQKEMWEFLTCPFPFCTMHIPFRKRKDSNICTHHVVIGGDCRRLFIVHRSVMVASPIEEKWCRNTRMKEPFYAVRLPAEMSLWFEKDENDKWRRIHPEPK